MSLSFLVCQLVSFIPPALHLSDFACDLGVVQCDLNPFVDTVFPLEDLQFRFLISLHYIWMDYWMFLSQLEVDPH